MNPLVSVIIPVFNGALYLGEAIESAITQDYSPTEIIVADDGSTDDSAAIARAYPGVNVLELEHLGVSAARNAAVDASQGEWLAFLDSDDLWLPGKLSAQVEAGMETSEVGFVLCEQMHKFEEIPSWFVWTTEPNSKTCFEPSAWLVRRSTFLEVGPFEAGRTLGEDISWLMRAWTLGVRHTVVRQTYLNRRIHGSNASAQLPSADRQLMTLLRESLAIKRAMKARSD